MKDLTLKPAPSKRQRHLTSLSLSLPVGGDMIATAGFTVVELDASNKVLSSRPEVSLALTDAELKALPAFNNLLNQLEKAAQDKRDLLP